MTPRAPPPWHGVNTVNWLVGGTLERIKLLALSPRPAARGSVPPVGTLAWVLAKQPSPHMVRIRCDRCLGPHRKSNTACAATLGIPTPICDPGAMYDFQTGEKIDMTWTCVEESCMPRAKVFSRIYRRTA